MNRRNWLDLFRKLVDVTDMDYTIDSFQNSLNEQALSFFGEGVLVTTTYPNPFPILMSGSSLGGSVGTGIAYDPHGQITRIDPGADEPQIFTIQPSHPSLERFDLLVIRYLSVGDTQVPKPSDPISTIFLNFHDDFQLAVIEGTPSATPSYPAKGPNDVILAGLQIPAGSTLGTQITVDLSVREIATRNASSLPVFVQETPTGVIDGSNKTFTLSQIPMSESLIICVDDLVLNSSEFSLVNNIVTLTAAPALGQNVYAFYIVNSPMSQNPLSMVQEIPSGTIDGTNRTFGLSGKPINQQGTMVFVDGVLSETSEWALIQSAGGAQIQFTSGSIPQPGQDIFVAYFVNAFGAGSGGGGGGGGGSLAVLLNGTPVDPAVVSMNFTGSASVSQTSSGHVQINIPGGYSKAVYGTPSSPITFVPSTGLNIHAENEQTFLLKTSGGIQNVTASSQIQNGTVIGQRLNLRGVDNANYYVFADGSNLSLNGSCSLTNNQCLVLEWDGTIWYEITRRS